MIGVLTSHCRLEHGSSMLENTAARKWLGSKTARKFLARKWLGSKTARKSFARKWLGSKNARTLHKFKKWKLSFHKNHCPYVIAACIYYWELMFLLICRHFKSMKLAKNSWSLEHCSSMLENLAARKWLGSKNARKILARKWLGSKMARKFLARNCSSKKILARSHH